MLKCRANINIPNFILIPQGHSSFSLSTCFHFSFVTVKSLAYLICPNVCNQSPNNPVIFPIQMSSETQQQDATPILCGQLPPPTHALSCSSGLPCHLAGPLTLPRFHHPSQGQLLHGQLTPQPACQMPLPMHWCPAHRTWFETTNWLASLWKHSSSHSDANIPSGMPSYENAFSCRSGSDMPG